LETSFQLKNVHLITYNKSDDVEAKFKCSEKITAVQHGDGISFGSSLILLIPFLFKISTQGVNKTLSRTTTLNIPIGGYLLNALGYLKVSPNGKKTGDSQ
jgi:hypothetical protein